MTVGHLLFFKFCFSAYPGIEFWIGAWNPRHLATTDDLEFDDGTSAAESFDLIDLSIDSTHVRCGIFKTEAAGQKPSMVFGASCGLEINFICEFSCPCPEDPALIPHSKRTIGLFDEEGVLRTL